MNPSQTAAELRVFISYRRSDCQPQANGLHDGLNHRLVEASVFMDIDSIPYGVDFEQHIRNEIAACHVVLVLIGDNWLDTDPASGLRRLDQPEDFVRLEIENALASPSVRVIPVLVEGAQMPRSAELPESISRLARLNAIELADNRWKSDLERLAGVVEDIGAAQRTAAPRSSPSNAGAVSFRDLHLSLIKAAVRSRNGRFQTKDISEDGAVLAAHEEVASRANYHAMVGRYLLQQAGQLGIESLGKGSGGRGESWQHVPSTTTTAEMVRPRGQAVSAASSVTRGEAPRRWWRRKPLVMVLVPIVSFSLLSWLPALLLRSRMTGRAQRRVMVAMFGCIGLTVGFLVLFAAAPHDATGNATGPLTDIGTALALGAMVLGTAVAVVHRQLFSQGGADSPELQSALARQQARARYRALAAQDVAVARDMGIGRPDLPRHFDDGGLIDLNSAPAEVIALACRVSQQEAAQVVAARVRFGALTGIDELVVHAGLSSHDAERLRDHAIFL